MPGLTGGDEGKGAGGEGGGKGAGGGGGEPWKMPELPDNWVEGLPEEIRTEENLPMLKQFKDFPALVKSLVHAQKGVGADKIVIPSKHATEADWKEVYKKLGHLPESVEKYDFKVPDVFKDDKEALGKLKAAAYEAGVAPKQFEKLLSVYGENLVSGIANQNKFIKNEQEAGVVKLKAEWGKAYDANLLKAQNAFKKFADEGLMALAKKTGLEHHPDLIKAFAKVGDLLVEDSLDGHGDAGGKGPLSPADAKKEYERILGDTQHPYWLVTHAGHATAVKEVQELFNQAYPGNA